MKKGFSIIMAFVTVMTMLFSGVTFADDTNENTENKTKESKNIIVRVDSKDTFMDYEIYNITIKNNNDSAICLTDTKSTNDIYIKDANDVKYGVYNHELLKNKMTIEPGYTTKLSFKFYSSYISNKEIKSLTFKNIDMNNLEGVEEYTIDW